MCGIAGYIEPPGRRRLEEARARLANMCDALKHRGPDDQGVWVEGEGRAGLGHRRLSILDLSPLGKQPMESANGRYVIAFNGEIYNFLELREELCRLGHTFRGGSDTEVLLAAFSQWGPEQTLPLLNGMFALALWDCEQQALLLARDRFGKKPLYYGQIGESWVFASELKALHQLPDFGARLDRDVLVSYVRYGYVPTPDCIYENFRKLTAGSYLWLKGSFRPVAFPKWKGKAADFPTLLREAVARRMISDVPLGAFLSGGIDSSLVVAVMQELSNRPVQTFTLGFSEANYDEAGFARRVAERLGTEHFEHYVTPRETLEVVPRLADLYDEPFSDSSQIPTFLISKLARSRVSVVLSGDGGDEIFGGYNRYLWGPQIWRILRLIPLAARRIVAKLIARVNLGAVVPIFGSNFAYPQDKLTKLAELMSIASPTELYLSLVSPWRQPGQVVLGGQERTAAWRSSSPARQLASFMMEIDQVTYLPDDILVKVDRASMAVGLEARAPLLDPDLAAWAGSQPLHLKIQGKVGKLALRRELYQRLPRELFERPKAGFAIPVALWLRKELRDWAEDLLSGIPGDGYLNERPIQMRWKQHLAGQRDWSASLWTILMFQAWLRRWRAS